MTVMYCEGTPHDAFAHLSEEARLFEDLFYQVHRKINVLLDIGQLLLENGANTNTVTRDLYRCAAYLGIPESSIHLHLSYHTLMINITQGEKSATCFRRVDKHVNNMALLAALSKLPWKALDQQYTLDEFETELHQIVKQSRRYPASIVKLGICIACGSLTILFGGTILAAFFTMLATFTGLLAQDLCHRWHFNGYIGTGIAAFVAMMTSSFMHMIFPSQEALIYSMICCTLFMVPGIPMVNAVDDLFNNYIVSGMTRFTHTLLCVGAMTFGLAVALHFMPVPDFTDVTILPENVHGVHLVASFFAASGFAILNNAPRKLLPLIGLGGTIAVTVRNLLIVDYGFYTPVAAFFGAAVMAIAMNRLASYFDTAQLVLAIPSVVTLIPGVFFYRFLFAIIQINELTPETLTTSMQNGVTAILIIMSIAVGVTVANMFGQHQNDKEKKKKLTFFLEERRRRFSEQV